jgi:hypothetical protein
MAPTSPLAPSPQTKLPFKNSRNIVMSLKTLRARPGLGPERVAYVRAEVATGKVSRARAGGRGCARSFCMQLNHSMHQTTHKILPPHPSTPH